MNVKTSVKAGCLTGVRVNRCEVLQRKAITMHVKTSLKS